MPRTVKVAGENEQAISIAIERRDIEITVTERGTVLRNMQFSPLAAEVLGLALVRFAKDAMVAQQERWDRATQRERSRAV